MDTITKKKREIVFSNCPLDEKMISSRLDWIVSAENNPEIPDWVLNSALGTLEDFLGLPQKFISDLYYQHKNLSLEILRNAAKDLP